MNNTKQTLFQIPFWHMKVSGFDKKKKELTEMLELYPEEKLDQEFSTNRQRFDNTSLISTDRGYLAENFASILKYEMNNISNELKKDIVVTDVWSVSYAKNEFHPPHNHGTTGLTGILYLDLPKGAPGTQFIQPWNNYETDRSEQGQIFVKEGDIIIVPKFLLHYTKPNKTNELKRIISWDMKLV